ncbi:CwfJ C-terminus 1-domain-containing protein-like protein [Armillaria luteobubalina]|uniref:CwfJ C-terminus 1-domain-containing protein-like protein n=1 Tax=Armillaria luteobubalina TaxID=153913 RepID=A0AA39UZ26_9AGAR|nr:CwfJ C-terminus 1-domain-containing protein-like protein [Armillaria luteobubalina]
MGDDNKRSKHKHSHGHDTERHSKKRHKHDDSRRQKKKRKHGEDKVTNILDEDPGDEDMWVEKNIDMDGERPLATDIPTGESLKLTSSASAGSSSSTFQPLLTTESTLKRDDWMFEEPAAQASHPSSSRIQMQDDEDFTEEYGEASGSRRTLGGGVDFFSTLGTDVRKKNSHSHKPDPEKPVISSRELNIGLREGKSIDESPAPAPKANVPGGPGSQWRMIKLRRVFETAEEEGLPVEQVAMDRFGSMEAFEEAKDERRILDEREGKRSDRASVSEWRGRSEGEKRIMFNDIGGSGASSRSSSFRRPGGHADSAPSTPTPGGRPPVNRRLDGLRLPSQAASPLQQSQTPIPSVLTPPAGGRGSSSRGLSPSSLNKLQAKVLRAKLMGAPDAEELEKEYEAASKATYRSDGGGTVRTKVEVLPTLDGQGRLYDVGHGQNDETAVLPGNRKKKEKVETRDPKTGNLVRINADDDTTTLGEMLRQEKFGGGMSDQKNLDAQFARAIMGDGKFQNDLDYMDENVEKLSRQKMRSDAMKRQFAIHDYKRTQQVLATCHFCFGEDDSPPKAPVIAMGTRAYLSCTTSEELVKGNCLIVPIQHHLTMLDGDDDVWDEVRNFMKCLMRMFAEEDQGVIFYETVISLKKQKHTCIECVPLPWNQYDLIPGYFKESILTSEAEWSQHKKLIDFSKRPGGFRRAMVPNLPYFMVQFDHKGDKGYGHVIEGVSDGADGEEGIDEGEKGSGEFPWYFAGEIIGNILELEPRQWRRPRRIDFRMNSERVTEFSKKYAKFDWTGMIGK